MFVTKSEIRNPETQVPVKDTSEVLDIRKNLSGQRDQTLSKIYQNWPWFVQITRPNQQKGGLIIHEILF